MNNESDNKLVLLNVETVKEKQSEEEGTERKNEEKVVMQHIGWEFAKEITHNKKNKINDSQRLEKISREFKDNLH